MLDHLRTAALTILATTPECTLSTAGPAGIQAALVRCLVADDDLYVLVPSGADTVVNVEHAPDVVLTTPRWQVHGTCMILGDVAQPTSPLPAALRTCPDAAGHVVMRVAPVRMHIVASQSQGAQTIDFDQDSAAGGAAIAHQPENAPALASAVGARWCGYLPE
jgi:hypothetical protein